MTCARESAIHALHQNILLVWAAQVGAVYETCIPIAYGFVNSEKFWLIETQFTYFPFNGHHNECFIHN